jgi:hypothetical protein
MLERQDENSIQSAYNSPSYEPTVPLGLSAFHEEVPIEYPRRPRSDIRPLHTTFRQLTKVVVLESAAFPAFGPTAQPLHRGHGIRGPLVSVSRFFPSLRQVHLTFCASRWPKRMFSRALVTSLFQTARSMQLAPWLIM